MQISPALKRDVLDALKRHGDIVSSNNAALRHLWNLLPPRPYKPALRNMGALRMALLQLEDQGQVMISGGPARKKIREIRLGGRSGPAALVTESELAGEDEEMSEVVLIEIESYQDDPEPVIAIGEPASELDPEPIAMPAAIAMPTPGEVAAELLAQVIEMVQRPRPAQADLDDLTAQAAQLQDQLARAEAERTDLAAKLADQVRVAEIVGLDRDEWQQMAEDLQKTLEKMEKRVQDQRTFKEGVLAGLEEQVQTMIRRPPVGGR